MNINSKNQNIILDTVGVMSLVSDKMCHIRNNGEPLPSIESVSEIVALCRAVIFPGFFGNSNVTSSNLEYHIGLNMERLYDLLNEQIAAGLCLVNENGLDKSEDIAANFISKLPELKSILATDVESTYLADPAATSTSEVIYCYPSIRATSAYRIANLLYRLGVPVIPRMITELAHSETGIDIHPAATIGESFTIDHGTGVVVGATSIIGHHVKIYQGVTLGAKSFDLDENNNPIKGIPRHPIIGNNVIIYSNTSILGRITIGDNAVIGGNLWITHDVAAGERLTQAPCKHNDN